ncbi:MAG: hypothetical protein N838_04705 [Thiohalocapsa sp. PB-PSB1]|nr:MAG: hypothetical protein N838_04705 [Thiohalocapsa sp. PB-PSB1]
MIRLSRRALRVGKRELMQIEGSETVVFSVSGPRAGLSWLAQVLEEEKAKARAETQRRK